MLETRRDLGPNSDCLIYLPGEDDMDVENAQELANDIITLATQAFTSSTQAADFPPAPKRSKSVFLL